MDFIEATYIINTPMFLGSSNNEVAEIRPPSFKGVLRFWFRALALSELNGDMYEVERLEGTIFGTTKGEKQQKALYSIKIDKNNIQSKGIGTNEGRQGIVYLGYGVIAYDKNNKTSKYIRSFIESNNVLKITLIKNPGIKVNISDVDFETGKKLLINALKCIGIFGGLGSRVRKGFGSLTLLELKTMDKNLIGNPYCSSEEALSKEIHAILNKSIEYGNSIDNIKYTAFSKFTKVVITKEFQDPMSLLDEIGREMVRYRSYGRDGKILNREDSLKIFQDDHDLMYKYISGENIDSHPRRVAFGLPHNYTLSMDKKKKANITVNSENRRSSPLFIHIHKLAERKYIGILTLIPAKFLRNDDKIKISSKKDKRINSLKIDGNIEDYKVVKDFLDRVVDKLSGEKIL